MRAFSLAVAALAAAVARAQSPTATAPPPIKTVVITVGGNTSADATLVFQPRSVVANLGDIVLFNFTEGNHTATQSTFASPCIPAHDSNSTINGFDSNFRPAGSFNAITILTVPITPDIVNTTLWFYDYNTCAKGGVGGININESSYENLDGFTRNAIRLNGTATTASSARHSSTAPPGSSSTSPSGHSSSAERTAALGVLGALPLILAALVL